MPGAFQRDLFSARIGLSKAYGFAINLSKAGEQKPSHEKNKRPYFLVYWLFNRDPYNVIFQ